jgi:hypothetical protein
MLAFARRCGFAETTRGLEPGVVRVERCVDRPLAVAEADGSRTGAVHRTVSRLLATFSLRRSSLRGISSSSDADHRSPDHPGPGGGFALRTYRVA